MLNTRQRMRTSSVGDGFFFFRILGQFHVLEKKKEEVKIYRVFPYFYPFFPGFSFHCSHFFLPAAGSMLEPKCLALPFLEKKKKVFGGEFCP